MSPVLGRAPTGALSGFGAVLAVQVAGGLVQTTGLLATVGPRGWATVSVGQTAGLLGATVASGGLMTFGASVVATAEPAERASLLLGTLRARAACAAAVLVLVVLVLAVVAPGPVAVAGLVSAGALASSLGASWYFVGRGEPGRWLRVDVLPLNGGAVLGVLATVLVPSAWAFGTCYLAGALLAVALSVRAVRRDRGPVPERPPVAVRAFLRDHRRLLAAGAAAGVNGQGPALLMAASGAPAVPTYLLVDRLVRYVVAGAAPMVQVTQSWVPAGGPREVPQRARRALSRVAVVAVLGALAFGLLVDVATRLLSHGAITVGTPERLLFAVLVAVLVLTQVNALAVLLPLGLERVLATSTALGAAGILVGGGLAAAVGGLRAILVVTLVVEAAVLATQLTAVARVVRARDGRT